MHIKYIYIILATLPLILCAAVCAQDADFLKEVESKLAYEENGGVFDFGEHLKSGGRRELAALADGLRLWIITPPREYPSSNATLIKGRIIEKKGKKQFYHDLMLFSALGASAIGFLAVIIVTLTIRRRSFRAYEEKLSQLGLLYGELRERIGDLGTDRYTDRFLELSERKEQLEASKSDMTEEVGRLIEDMQSLLAELEAAAADSVHN